MKKHFFKRILTIIITFAVVFLLGFLFIVIVPGNAALGILYNMIYIILFMIVLVVLGLVLDSSYFPFYNIFDFHCLIKNRVIYINFLKIK